MQCFYVNSCAFMMSTSAQKTVTLQDKTFSVFIPENEILAAVKSIADKINADYSGKEILFVAVLNGSFLFAADLLKNILVANTIDFVKLASYSGTTTTGSVKQIIGLNVDVKNKTVIVLEDIVDTGITLENIYNQLAKMEPKEIKTAALLFKPQSYSKSIAIDYSGIEIPNDFIVGYGLDYDGLGRNLRDIYVLNNK